MNFRGCMCSPFLSINPHVLIDRILVGAGVPLTTAQLYSGAHTDDLRSTLLYIREVYPDAPLLGIGFSLVSIFHDQFPSVPTILLNLRLR